MNIWLKLLGKGLGWYTEEYIKDYRDNSARIYELQVKTNGQINQIILTVSVASLAAVAALNERVFLPYGILSFLVIVLFISTILLTVINLYLSNLSLKELQQKLKNNLTSLKSLDRGASNLSYGRIQNTLNIVVPSLFCIGLTAFVILLGFYILGWAK